MLTFSHTLAASESSGSVLCLPHSFVLLKRKRGPSGKSKGRYSFTQSTGTRRVKAKAEAEAEMKSKRSARGGSTLIRWGYLVYMDERVRLIGLFFFPLCRDGSRLYGARLATALPSIPTVSLCLSSDPLRPMTLDPSIYRSLCATVVSLRLLLAL